MTAIHDPGEFLRTFKPGDAFWEITTDHGEPDGVEARIFVRLDEASTEKFKDYPTLGGTWIIVGTPGKTEELNRHLGGIVQADHGAFASESEARAEFARQREAYAADPEWQDKVAQRRRRPKWLWHNRVERKYTNP